MSICQWSCNFKSKYFSKKLNNEHKIKYNYEIHYINFVLRYCPGLDICLFYMHTEILYKLSVAPCCCCCNCCCDSLFFSSNINELTVAV